MSLKWEEVSRGADFEQAGEWMIEGKIVFHAAHPTTRYRINEDADFEASVGGREWVKRDHVPYEQMISDRWHVKEET